MSEEGLTGSPSPKHRASGAVSLRKRPSSIPNGKARAVQMSSAPASITSASRPGHAQGDEGGDAEQQHAEGEQQVGLFGGHAARSECWSSTHAIAGIAPQVALSMRAANTSDGFMVPFTILWKFERSYSTRRASSACETFAASSHF